MNTRNTTADDNSSNYLREGSLTTLRNRREVGLRWVFDLYLDKDGKPTKYAQRELPVELECWWGIVSVYAQGAEYSDSVKIGVMTRPDFEGAESWAEMDVLAEKIIRAELAVAGIAAGVTESRQHPLDPSESICVVPVSMGATV